LLIIKTHYPMKTNTFLLFFFISSFCVINSTAQEGDKRIERQLISMGLQYELTSTGSFKLLFELEQGRTQMVFIQSVTKKHEDVEVREISSPAKIVSMASELSHDRLWLLLANNSQSVLGAWQLEPVNDVWILNYTVKVPALMPDHRLMMYLVLLAKEADKMEQSFSNEDVY
jgi:hypothetical protein